MGFRSSPRLCDDADADEAVHSNAGFFLYIDLSPWMPNEPAAANPEFELAGKLLKAGVGLHPGEEHYERRGWFRLVFSVERDVLEEGLKR